MDKNLERLETDLELMNPTNRWVVLQKLAAYFMPTLTKNVNTNVNSGAMKIIIEYAESVDEKSVDE